MSFDSPMIYEELSDYIVETDDGPKLEVDYDGYQRTVDIRDVYPYEDDLVNSIIKENIDGPLRGNNIPIKGRWIRGWLEVHEDDYPRNMFLQYQFFIRYITAVTSRHENIQTYSLSPGTYDSMYRYIIILEDLGLIERYKHETVPQEEYSHHVPEQFRQRVYVRKISDGEDEDVWNHPYRSMYPEAQKEAHGGYELIDEDISGEDVSEDEEVDEIDEDNEIEDEESSIDQYIQNDTELPSSGANITDLDGYGDLLDLIDDHFEDAVEYAVNGSPIEQEEVQPEYYMRGRVAVLGAWANNNAVPGKTELDLVVGIDDTKATLSPGYILTGVQAKLAMDMNQDNTLQDIFPQYSIYTAFSNNYKEQAININNAEGLGDRIYCITNDEYLD